MSGVCKPVWRDHNWTILDLFCNVIVIVVWATNLVTWWIVRITINDSCFRQKNTPMCVYHKFCFAMKLSWLKFWRTMWQVPLFFFWLFRAIFSGSPCSCMFTLLVDPLITFVSNTMDLSSPAPGQFQAFYNPRIICSVCTIWLSGYEQALSPYPGQLGR